jgi:hypothetical protein
MRYGNENDPIDRYLRRCLKDWVSYPHPPVFGRSRLLGIAAGMVGVWNRDGISSFWSPPLSNQFFREIPQGATGLVSLSLDYPYRFPNVAL